MDFAAYRKMLKARQEQRAGQGAALMLGINMTPQVAGEAMDNFGRIKPGTNVSDLAMQTQQMALEQGNLVIDWLNDDPSGHPALVDGDLPAMVNFEHATNEAYRAINGRGFGIGVRGAWIGFKESAAGAAKGVAHVRASSTEKLYGELVQMRSGRPVHEITSDPTRQGFLLTFEGMDEEAFNDTMDKMRSAVMSEEYIGERLEDLVDQFSRRQQAMRLGRVTDLTDIRDFRDFQDWASVGGGEVLTSLLMYGAAGKIGGATGLFSYATLSEGGAMLAEADLDKPGTLGRIMFTAPVSGMVELIGGVPTRALGIRRQLLRRAFSDVTEDVMERVGKGYARRIGKDWVAGSLRIGKDWVAGSLEEMLQETAQFFLSEYGVEGEDFRFDDETLSGALNAAALGLMGGFGGQVMMGTRGQIALEKAARASRDAGLAVKTIEELGAVTKDLQLAKVSEEGFASWVKKLGLDNLKIFYQAETVQDFVAAQGLDLEATLKKLGVNPIDFAMAVANGHRVPVSAAGVTRIGLTDEANIQTWAENATFRPDGATMLETKAFKTLRTQIEAEIADQARISELSPSRQAIVAQVTEAAVGAGRSPEEATQVATVTAAWFETMAQMYGGKDMSGADLFERVGFNIQGSQGLDTPSVSPPGEAPAGVNPPSNTTPLDAPAGATTLNQVQVENDFDIGEKTGVPLDTRLTAASTEVQNAKFRTGRELKRHLQNLARSSQERAGIDLTGETPEAAAALADFLVADARAALANNKNAIGWYDHNLTAAWSFLEQLHPELATSPEARFTFIWALAVTSNGLKVNKNFEVAEAAYEYRKANDTFPPDFGIGTSADAINKGLALHDTLITHFGGWQALADFMTTEREVHDIESALAEIHVLGKKKAGIPVTGEAKGTRVRGSAILGPKIGEGFFSNLYGHYNALTMDRWLVRTIGRWRGTLIDDRPDMVFQKVDEIRTILQGLGAIKLRQVNALLTGSGVEVSKEMTDDEIASLAGVIQKRSTSGEWRKQLSSIPGAVSKPGSEEDLVEGGDALRLAGNSLASWMDGQIEAPKNGSERNFFRAVFRDGLERLRQEPGTEALTMADLQALLWYPEKLLYDSAKMAEGDEVLGYADEEAPNYANAARRLLQVKRSSADRAGQSPARTSGQGPAPSEAGAGGDVGGAGQDAGSPVTAEDLTAFAETGDPDFLTRPGWVVITGMQEALGDQFSADNLAANAALVAQLEELGLAYAEVEGMYQGEAQGASYLILAPRDVALALGQDYLQESILTNEGLVYSDEVTPNTPATGEVMTGDTALAEDFYSQFDGGTAFSMGLDFDAVQTLNQSASAPVRFANLNDLSFEIRDAVEQRLAALHGLEFSHDASNQSPATYLEVKQLDEDGDIDDVFKLRIADHGDRHGSDHTVRFEDVVEDVYDGEDFVEITIEQWKFDELVDEGVGAVAEALGLDEAAVDVVNYEQANRGYIQMAEGLAQPALITLLEGADPSTLMHELGHFFLEGFRTLAADPNAPQLLKDDFDKVNMWLERSPDDMSAFTTEQQEQWAEAFEKYLATGVAPSPALKGAFHLFKRWLAKVYAMTPFLQVNLDPVITDIFDRMLATEEEIEAAKIEESMGPLLLQKPPGMAEETYELYRRAAALSDAEGSAKLLAKAMKTVTDRKGAEFRKRREELVAEYTAGIAQQRHIKLVDTLRATGVKLSREQLLERFGPAVVEDLGRYGKGKAGIVVKGGLDLEAAAEMGGYDGADGMIGDLTANGPLAEMVNRKVNTILANESADVMASGEMRREAVEALHNNDRWNTLAMEEAEILRQLADVEEDNLPAGLTVKEARVMAASIMADTSVQVAENPDVFLRAERQAGRLAQEAFGRVARAAVGGATLGTSARADLLKAHAAKRKQLLNSILYSEAKKVQKIVRQTKALEKRVKKSRRKGKTPTIASPFLEELEALLEQYDFRKLSGKETWRVHGLQALVQQMEKDGIAEFLLLDPDVVASVQRKPYGALTSAQLRGLKDSLDNLEHLGRKELKGIYGEQAVVFHELVRGAITTLDLNFGDQEVAPSMTQAEKRLQTAHAVLNSFQTPDTLAHKWDKPGKDDVGFFGKTIKIPLQQAMARVQARQHKARQDYDALIQKYYGGNTALSTSREFRSEVGASLTKAEILAIALNTGNAQNTQRLMSTRKGRGFTLDETSLQALLDGHMTDADWHFVQDVWDMINSYWGEIAKTQRARTGVYPKKVDAALGVRAPSFVRGGYYPIQYDRRLGVNVSEFENNDIFSKMRSGQATQAQTRNGHLKERKEVIDKLPDLSLSVGVSHINDVILDLELGGALSNAWRLLNNPTVSEKFKDKGLEQDRMDMLLALQDAALGDRQPAKGLDVVFRHMRGGLSISRMAFSLTTMVQQILGLTNSAVAVGKREMASAIWQYATNPIQVRDMIAETSPFMVERQRTMERDIVAFSGELDENPVYGKMKAAQRVFIQAGFAGIQKLQYYAVDLPTWLAAYRKHVRKHGDPLEAAAQADLMVSRAQGSGLLSDRTGIERGSIHEQERFNEVARLLTTFGSYMISGKLNLTIQRFRSTDFKNPGDIANLMVDMMLMYVVETLLALAITNRWFDDEEDDEGLPLWLAKEIGFGIMGTVPILRDAPGALEGFGGGGSYGDVVETVFDIPVDIATLATGLEDRPDAARNAVKGLMAGTGLMLHLPTVQLERAMTGLVDRDMSLRDDLGLDLETLKGLAYGRRD